jgi:translation initiation factor 3 subunit D
LGRNDNNIINFLVCQILIILFSSFVSRANVRATDKHVILGMQQFRPQDFGAQIALNMDNSWGIVRCIIDYLNKQKDGKYIIMKDPNKVVFKLIFILNSKFIKT